MSFEQAIKLLHDGRISFNEFYRVTLPSWQRLARYLLRRWQAPWVDLEDIVQELLRGAWESVWRYSPTLANGRTIDEFVQYNAVDKAKKKLHQMRNAKRSGNADKAPSRCEVAFSTLVKRNESATEWLESLLPADAGQSDVVEHKQRIEKACRSDAELRVIRILAETGDIIQGAIRLFDDEQARVACGLKTPRDAGRFVASTAFAVAQRLNQQAA